MSFKIKKDDTWNHLPQLRNRQIAEIMVLRKLRSKYSRRKGELNTQILENEAVRIMKFLYVNPCSEATSTCIILSDSRHWEVTSGLLYRKLKSIVACTRAQSY